MTYPLAVFNSAVGDLHETFIKRHMLDLVPGGTVIVAATGDKPNIGHWHAQGPVLIADRIEGDVPSAVRTFLIEHGVRACLGEYLDQSLRWVDIADAAAIPFFAHAHGYDVSEAVLAPLRRGDTSLGDYRRYARTAGLIAPSDWIRTALIDIGFAPARVHAIPYGIDVPPAPRARVPRDVVRCVAVSRLVAVKGPMFTLDAFRRAAEVVPALHLDYIGGGPLLPALRQYVQAFKLEDRVALHGTQPNDVVNRTLRDSDIFLQHSVRDPDNGAVEALGVSVIEAMADALPVVATRHGGVAELVLDEATGYLVPETDVAAMADGIVQLARDPDLRRRFGEAGWRRAAERFSWSRERTDLLRVLGFTDDAYVRPEPALPKQSPQSARARRASLVADPNPIRVKQAPLVGVTTITWEADGGGALEVRVDAPHGPLFAGADSSGRATTGTWVRNGTTFYLQDVSGGKALSAENTLASVQVRVIESP